MIDDLQAPSAWKPGSVLEVAFTLRNSSNAPTSGVVNGGAYQNVVRRIVGTSWSPWGVSVNDLQPNDHVSGLLKMDHWTSRKGKGAVAIALQYWVEDPNGPITFVSGPPEDWINTAKTYGVLCFVSQTYLSTAPVSFANDILPLFRDSDIFAMQERGLDLSSYDQAKLNADTSYNRLTYPTLGMIMPCDGRWPSDWIDLFKQWMDDGLLH